MKYKVILKNALFEANEVEAESMKLAGGAVTFADANGELTAVYPLSEIFFAIRAGTPAPMPA